MFTTLIFIIHFLCFIFEGGFASQLKVAVRVPKKNTPQQIQSKSSHTQPSVPSRRWNRQGEKKNENIKTNFKTIKPFAFLASRCPGLGRVRDWLAFGELHLFLDRGPPRPRNQLTSARRTFTHEVGKASTHTSRGSCQVHFRSLLFLFAAEDLWAKVQTT